MTGTYVPFMESMRAVAAWQVARGRPEDRPMIVIDATGAPENVVAHAEVLRSLTYDDFLTGESKVDQQILRDEGSGMSLYSVLNAFWTALSEREIAVLVGRVVSNPPATLQSLGARFKVSHQRIAQIEAELRRRLTEHTLPGTYFGSLINDILSKFSSIVPLAELLDRVPVLAADMPGTSLKTWNLLGTVVPGIDVEGPWAAIPSVAHQKEVTQRIIREQAVFPGLTPIGEQRAHWPYSTDELADWLGRCGFVLFQNFVVEPAPNAVGAVTQVLLIAGRAQSLEQIADVLEQLGVPRARSTLVAALRHQLFTRTADDRWDLSDRPHTFNDVLASIHRKVDRTGSIPLAELREQLTQQGVPAACVEVYTDYGAYQTVEGHVTRRDKIQPLAGAPACSPGLYRLDDGWGELITLSARDLATRTIRVSTAVATALSLRWQHTQELSSIPGAVLDWTAYEVFLSLPMEALQPYQVGDRIYVWVSDDGVVELRDAAPVVEFSDDLGRALNLVGQLPTGESELDQQRLAQLVNLPEDSDMETLRMHFFLKRDFVVSEALCDRGWNINRVD